jgi:predicted translin family RNA/ssDNA-binding protein
LEKCRVFYQQLAATIPKSQFYKFSDQWNWTTQRLVSIIALVIYLEAGFLVTRDTAAEILGLKSNQADGFHLDIEMYLLGVLQMTDDLSRFAVNSASMGDYARVQSLQAFIGNINSGYRLLNLKNDALRKKFDR